MKRANESPIPARAISRGPRKFRMVRQTACIAFTLPVPEFPASLSYSRPLRAQLALGSNVGRTRGLSAPAFAAPQKFTSGLAAPQNAASALAAPQKALSAVAPQNASFAAPQNAPFAAPQNAAPLPSRSPNSLSYRACILAPAARRFSASVSPR